MKAVYYTLILWTFLSLTSCSNSSPNLHNVGNCLYRNSRLESWQKTPDIFYEVLEVGEESYLVNAWVYPYKPTKETKSKWALSSYHKITCPDYVK